MRMIKHGYMDACIAGGFDKSTATFHDFLVHQIGATSLPGDDLASSFKAFDKNSGTSYCGDGGAFVVLESEEHALARGAKLICEVKGYHTLSYGQDFLLNSQIGIQKLLSNISQQTGWHPSDLDVINAHGTGTIKGDQVEIDAIKTYLGSKFEDVVKDKFAGPSSLDLSKLDKTIVNSLKGYMGHMFLAGGSTELVMTIRAMQDNIVFATPNLKDPIDLDLNLLRGNHQEK
mmetsp:Transcript_25460/g.19204  ORF Transcript_25460/g.19204 Transcript_25460/m.19204 type:complete len:231 (+) Transcript_25460:1-693(+)|eukprot:CAMPEP_0202957298 /NCGR_PEP_ID=MMETSP1396-20130829/1734_1 /ASSEMBLY_ACC=CAM_ASM_000872 /TAXON_ID= /ORGANISM="Pseudokeronopsis sp., Strain Brazil" /LENGTH=230 /DNA_ID=CAMNT_0049674725 /DNA_START=558 /DNA_END=1250 /DNA_ORIENTATION=+